MTERACLPDPPCDCSIVTVLPVLLFQAAAKASSIASYSSRVGS